MYSRSCFIEFNPISRKLLFTLLLMVLAFGFTASPARAEESSVSNLILILDSSGSMAAQIQGKAKIAVAKEVISDFVKNLPAGIEVGLTAYRHREKNDCQDVEELAPLGPVNKEALLGKIKSMQPKGMTPITYSVRKVVESLKGVEGETTIILVSDGEETCKADPCALVKELKAAGAKFILHVIGFDVGDKEKAQLSCIAQAGGGSYFTAKNANELGAATKKVVEKTEKSSANFKVKALRNGKPFSAFVKVFKSGQTGDEEKEKQEIAGEWTGEAGVSIKLLPGVYDVIVENNEDVGKPTIAFQAVTIEPGKNVEKTADFSGGSLKVKALRNGKPFSAFVKIFKSGQTGDEEKEKQEVAGEWTGEEGVSIKLLPGIYDLLVENNEDAGKPSISIQAVTVEPGKSIEKVVDFSGGTMKVKALRNGKPFSAFAKVFKAGQAEDEEQEVQEVAGEWTGEEGTVIKLLPGLYDLLVENNEDAGMPSVAMKAITIEPGKVVEKTASFSGGTLKVKASKNGKPLSVYCKIFKPRAADEEEEAAELTGNWTNQEGAAFKLPVGQYDVLVETQDSTAKKEIKGIAIEAGKINSLEVKF